METILSFLKSSFFKVLIISLITYLTPLTSSYAERGCCSKHNGVAGCNNATGFLTCKDGTQSPSCKCSGTTTKPSKSKTSILPTWTLPTTTTPTSTKGKSAATSKRGCCKGHGGIAGCDSKSGYNKCKDGTLSASCKCK